VADGLAPFRKVDVAVITGMGAHTILRILREGPTPTAAIVHAPEYSDRLRRGLAEQGWRIVNERLAPEANRYAEVIHIERGDELNRGYQLEFGPLLSNDPLHLDHANQLLGHKLTVIKKAPEGTRAHTEASGWIEWLREYISTYSPSDSTT
jgi:tRNA A22 N-methylase